MRDLEISECAIVSGGEFSGKALSLVAGSALLGGYFSTHLASYLGPIATFASLGLVTLTGAAAGGVSGLFCCYPVGSFMGIAVGGMAGAALGHFSNATTLTMGTFGITGALITGATTAYCFS